MDPNSAEIIRCFATAHLEKKRITQEAKQKRSLINARLAELRGKIVEIFSEGSGPVIWNETDTDGSASHGCIKLKANTSKRKLSSIHVRDVVEGLELPDLHECFNHETRTDNIESLAEIITEMISNARTVTTTSPQVQLTKPRVPKNVTPRVATPENKSMAVEIVQLQEELKAISEEVKERMQSVNSQIEDCTPAIEQMMRTKEIISQKVQLTNDGDETYFIRVKDETSKNNQSLNSESLFEVLTTMLQEELPNDIDVSHLPNWVFENKQFLIDKIIEYLLPSRENAEEESSSLDGGQKRIKLCFDKSTGTRKRARTEDNVGEDES